MARGADPVRWLLGGLAVFALVLYWFLPRAANVSSCQLSIVSYQLSGSLVEA